VTRPRLVLFATLAACTLSACSSNVEPRTVEVDCSVNDDYDFNILQPMEGTMVSWFAFGDVIPDATEAFTLTPIPEGRCESTAALVLTARGHTDWGAGFGEYQTPQGPVDATGYDGVSFWARAPTAHTSLGFLMTVQDRNTHPSGGVCVMPVVDVTNGAYTYNEAGMIVPVGGDLPSPLDCGNGFQRVVRVTRDWQLYLLPFESFQQQAQPNRVPTGLDRSGIYQFSINIPKDSIVELWIDDLGVYRRTAEAPEPGGSVEPQAVDFEER